MPQTSRLPELPNGRDDNRVPEGTVVVVVEKFVMLDGTDVPKFSPQAEWRKLFDVRDLEIRDDLPDRRACVKHHISRRLGKSRFTEFDGLATGDYRVGKTRLNCQKSY